MDSELRQYLEEMRQDIKQDIKAHTAGQIDTVKAHTAGQIDAFEERLTDMIRTSKHEMEMRIVAEFWKQGRTSDMRMREALTDTTALAARLLGVEDRVSALERRPSA